MKSCSIPGRDSRAASPSTEGVGRDDSPSEGHDARPDRRVLQDGAGAVMRFLSNGQENHGDAEACEAAFVHAHAGGILSQQLTRHLNRNARAIPRFRVG